MMKVRAVPMVWSSLLRIGLACSVACCVLRPELAAAQSAPTAAQLDTLVAPVALYPDALLADVLAASTYPVEIVEAARAVANGGKPTSAEMSQWDPSIQALTGYPTVLTMMNNQLDWTTQLGQAVSQNQGAVMAAAQRVRAEAQKAGNLQSNDKQTVTTQGSTIIIQPASPQVIYVPQYNPVTIIEPAPAYVAAPAGYGLMTFGAGFAVGALTAYAFDWGGGHGGNITVNNNYNYYHQTNYNHANYTNVHGGGYSAWHSPTNVGRIGSTTSTGGTAGTHATGGGNYTTRPATNGGAAATHPAPAHSDGSWSDADHAAADTRDVGGATRGAGDGMFAGSESNGWATRAASDRGAQSFGGGDRGFGGFSGARRR
jgi:hypothetical protein